TPEPDEPDGTGSASAFRVSGTSAAPGRSVVVWSPIIYSSMAPIRKSCSAYHCGASAPRTPVSHASLPQHTLRPQPDDCYATQARDTRPISIRYLIYPPRPDLTHDNQRNRQGGG